MSAFDIAALPGKIPGSKIKPSELFRSPEERARYEKELSDRRLNAFMGSFDVKNVKVEIFDISDEKDRKKYEELYRDLLVKTSRGEAFVERSRDLVRRADGTSYWMIYLEYVELGVKEIGGNGK